MKEKIKDENHGATGDIPKVSYFELFRFATLQEKIMMVIAIISATGVGVSQPLMLIVFGDMTDSFVDAGKYSTCDKKSPYYNNSICFLTILTLSEEEIDAIGNPDDFFDEMIKVIMNDMIGYTWTFIGIGLVTWLLAWIQATSLMIASNRQSTRLRIAFFQSIMRQDVGYFDTNSASELNTRLVDDVTKIHNGIGDKIGVLVQAVMQFVGGLVIGVIYGWKMALVILGTTPLLAFTGYIFFTVTTRFSKSQLDAYAKAGEVAEEVLSSIKTVTAFSGQEEELQRYTENLTDAKYVGIKKQTATGLSLGILYLCLFSVYGLAFWYGSTLILQPEDQYTIGQVITVFFSVLIGAFGLSQAGQNAEFFATAQAAAYTVYQVMDRVPDIDWLSDEGKVLENLRGKIKFENVNFTYPARPDQQILHDVSFEAQAGQTVALCGQSGCGKSTCIQLLQRFYNTNGGQITIDDVPIQDINVKWLREQIGIVSQEPILFDVSIKENIKMGRLDVSDEEIDNALRDAHAYDFVNKLPQKLDTHVGEGGATLSGGQKQRIAIARALVRNPSILLLDEATSALDTESESIVQAALDKVSEGRTTIVIAHRLSTIKNADKIIGFMDGRKVEEGTHESLLKIDHGVYLNLCNLQTFDAKAETKEDHNVTDKVTNARHATKKPLIATKSAVSVFSKSEEIEEEYAPEAGLSSVFGLNRPELCYNIFGSIIAFVAGGLQPIFALIFAEILGVFGKYACAYDKDIEELVEGAKDGTISNVPPHAIEVYEEIDICSEESLMDEVVIWCLVFVGIGVADFIIFPSFSFLFGKSGEELTLRLRGQSFKKYLQLEMAYFDDVFNSTGSITSKLASDTSKVQGAIGGRLGSMCQNIGALGVAFVIGFYYEWRLTLVCLAFMPPLVGSMAVMISVFTGGSSTDERAAFEEAGKCTTEATMNVRTVASLGREQVFISRYASQLVPPLKNSIKQSWIFGFMYGMSNGLVFLMYATVLYYASRLIETGKLPAEQFDSIYKVLMAIVMGAMTAGQTGALAANVGEAKVAANRIIDLLARESSIDPENEGGKILDDIQGRLKFISVDFIYPTRPNIRVLRGLELIIEAGETVALVGHSGCGKSTCIQLAERFYDASSGLVSLDGVPVNQLNVQWLRQQIGFVQQEPVLFNRTIRENITYGTNIGNNKVGTRRVLPEPVIYSDKDVMQACEEANAKAFINQLPSKLETGCGRRGNQLSGGQKQRIAIARAIIRKPKILLLDEATSALDTESEKVVQDALNKASKGRTCIIIAHRLSTVINADKIAVIDNGEVVEIGKHDELIANKGAYYSLVNSQL